MSPASALRVLSGVGQARQARLAAARLYLVTDDRTPGAELPSLISESVAGGVDVVQLRRKVETPLELEPLARACREAAQGAGALFLVDDHVELARAVEADGVHLGQEDLTVPKARETLGPDALIGLSTHTPEQARSAAVLPVDYISAGPVRATPTKPGRPAVGLEYVSQAAWRTSLPVVAIGGLDAASAAAAIEAGAGLVGVVRAICAAANPRAAAAELRAAIAGAAPWPMLSVNGDPRRCRPGATVGELLEALQVRVDGVVVERNGEILGAEALMAAPLAAGDRLEVVHLVGGGSGDG